MTKKIAVIVDHYKLRADVREMISCILKTQDATIFSDEPTSKLIDNNFDVRVMKPLPTTIKNSLLKQVYYYFGGLPKTRANYRNYIIRRLHKLESGRFWRYKQLLKLKLKLWLPDLLSFDKYIELLDCDNEILEEFSVVLSFTDINNENMIANVLAKKIPLYTYVYSWDHIAKFHRFSKNKIKYITWSKKISSDLQEVHGIPEENIYPLAATQYAFIHDYLQSNITVKKSNPRVFYFVASFGYPKLVKQELKVIQFICNELQKIDSRATLVFRPYPMLSDWSLYEPLQKISNLRFDQYKKRDGVLLDKDDVKHKLDMIQKSIAVLHCGTTIGIEASYFNTPVLYVVPEDIDYEVKAKDLNHIEFSWDQYHLTRYFNLKDYSNVINTRAKLGPAIAACCRSDEQYLAYNHEIQKISPLVPMEKLCTQLVDIYSKSINV